MRGYVIRGRAKAADNPIHVGPGDKHQGRFSLIYTVREAQAVNRGRRNASVGARSCVRQAKSCEIDSFTVSSLAATMCRAVI